MSYYQGDYYRGGFLSFLGGIAKKAVGFIPGVGPIASAAIGATQALVKRAAPAAAGAAKMISKHPVLSAAAAAGAVGGGASMMGHHGTASLSGKKPRRLANSAFEAGRRRRVNVCNPRALRRAIRRTHGFAKLAMKTIHLVHPKKHARFGGFKKRRRK